MDSGRGGRETRSSGDAGVRGRGRRRALGVVLAAALLVGGGVFLTVGDPGVTRAGERPPVDFVRPDSLRGIYLNAWLAGSRSRTDSAFALARRTEINTFVIDLKDASGYVSHRTEVVEAREVGADGEVRIRDLPGLLDRLRGEGIYPVARIVVFKDPLLALRRPELAVQHRDGGPWVDGRGELWVNPYDRRIWDYHVALAREAVALGFPEIQWDYIRFPDRPASELESARFPGSEGISRAEAVRGFLLHARRELAPLGVPLTADVFGVTTTMRSDVGIGQRWEDLMVAADALLPMVYPSHYWAGSFGFANPNAHPYDVVLRAVREGMSRSAGVDPPVEIIPWLQDFTLGEPRYGIPEVRAQIMAVEDLGLPHWFLWNAAGRYTEGALRPAGGWGEGGAPPIRRWGRVIPAAARHEPPPVPEPEPGPGTDRVPPGLP